jgi:hypothetical protein
MVWRWVVNSHVALNAAGSALTAVGKFSDQVVGEDLCRRSGYDDLDQQLGRCPGFL